MQQEVEPVIAAGLFAVSQNRVVKEVREGSEGTVKAALAVGPPVSVVQDQLNVGGGCVAQAWVVEDEPAVIQNEAALEEFE